MYKQILLAFLLAFLLASLSFAAESSPRHTFGGFSKNGVLMLRQSGCGSDNVCGDSCSPIGTNCCNSFDGSSTYCEAGNSCVTDGCCPSGETCSGGGGTITYYSPPTSLGGGVTSVPTSFTFSNGDLSSEIAALSSAFAGLTSLTDWSSELAGLSATLADLTSVTDLGFLTSTTKSSSTLTDVGLTVLSHSTATTAQNTLGLVLSTPTQTGSSSQSTSSSGNKVASGGVPPRVVDGKSVVGGVIFVAAAILL